MAGMWFLLATAAAAAPTLERVQGPVDADLPGRHARPFVDAEGAWRLGFGRSGAFHAVPIADDLRVGLEEQVTLVPPIGAVDHGFVACPEGEGWLHLASAHGASLDDSATATRLNDALEVTAQRTVLRDSTELVTNDMAVVCGAGLVGAAFAQRGIKGEGDDEDDQLFLLTADWFTGEAPPAVVDVSPSTRVTGNAMRWEPDPGRLLIFGWERDIGLRIAEFDAELAFVAHHDVPVLDEPLVGWWAHGILEVDEHYLLIHMVGDPAAPWGLDTGDVGLTVLTRDFQLVSQQQLTTLTPPNGAMRPSLARRGDQILVSYDVGGQIHLLELRLGAAAEAGDTDGPDDPTADTDDTDGAGPSDEASGGRDGPADAAPPASGCGCAQGPHHGGILAIVLGALGCVSGRRRGRADRAPEGAGWLR